MIKSLNFTYIKSNISYVFLILCYLKFFFLFSLPWTFGVKVNQILPMLFVDVYFVANIFKHNTLGLRDDFFSKWMLFFYIFLAIECVYTSIVYPREPIINAFKETAIYTSFLSYYIFVECAKRNLKKFIKFLVNCCTIVASLLILQALMFKFFGIYFLQIYGFNYGEISHVYRDDNIRLMGPDLITFVGILSIGLYFQKENSNYEKKIFLINILSTFVYLLTAEITRSSQIGLIIILFFTFSLEKEGRFKIFILAILLLVFFSTYVIDYIMKSYLLITEQTDYSIYHRLETYEYYAKSSFFDRIPLGIGLLKDQPEISSYLYIEHGEYGKYCYSDVGLVGTMGRFGIVGGIFYMAIIIKCYKVYKKSKSSNSNAVPVNFAIICLILFSLVNLSVFDAERIMILPIVMAISRVYNENIINERSYA